MKQLFRKAAILSLAVLMAMGIPSAGLIAHAAEADLSDQLIPVREDEFGEKVGPLLRLDGGKTVVQNFERGYVTAELISETQVQNKRDVGGMRMSEEGKREFLDLSDWIKGRGTDPDVRALWNKLAGDYQDNTDDFVPRDDQALAYNPAHALGKISEEYASLCEQGFNCGIPTDNLSVWDKAVIKLDFYDGDCEYGFENSNRVHVTTIAYSLMKDCAYMITGEIFNFYRNAKAGSLAEPVSDPFEYTLDGKEGLVQTFVRGYIFQPEKGEIIVRAGMRYNEDANKFESIALDYDDITETEIVQVAIDGNPYYGGKGFTVESVKDLFYDKYLDLIDEGFNPGIPDAEGIFYWDSELLKQAYVGSDGTGNAWGRTNMMLILNPDTKEVYKVSGEILNIVDESSQGLGTATKLGYPLFDEKTTEINGLTYTYQDFTQGTIYSIENSPQLTRFLKGVTFEGAIKANNITPNNPAFFYVLEPWAIALIIAGGVLLIGGGAAAAVLLSRKKKKAAAAAEGNSEQNEEGVS